MFDSNHFYFEIHNIYIHFEFDLYICKSSHYFDIHLMKELFLKLYIDVLMVYTIQNLRFYLFTFIFHFIVNMFIIIHINVCIINTPKNYKILIFILFTIINKRFEFNFIAPQNIKNIIIVQNACKNINLD